MVTAKESQTGQQLSASNSPESKHMAVLHVEKNYSLPCFYPSNLHGLNTDLPYAFGGLSNLGPSNWDFSYPTETPTWTMPHGLGVTEKPVETSYAPQKKFLIFDQSGNQTRLFVSPSFPTQHQTVPSKPPPIGNGLSSKVSAQVDEPLLMNPVVEEKWDGTRLTDKEGDMLEDTEEINALLYSDSDDDEYGDDDDGDDDDGDDEEVTSTGHTPFISTDKSYYKDQLGEELMEEVASSDGSPKRRKLLDGRYKKSSPCRYENDEESSCSPAICDYIDSSSKRETYVKIREALKKLESIIPGLKSNDPLSIIDKAIAYLETMKFEAEALELGHPESKSATFT